MRNRNTDESRKRALKESRPSPPPSPIPTRRSCDPTLEVTFSTFIPMKWHSARICICHRITFIPVMQNLDGINMIPGVWSLFVCIDFVSFEMFAHDVGLGLYRWSNEWVSVPDCRFLISGKARPVPVSTKGVSGFDLQRGGEMIRHFFWVCSGNPCLTVHVEETPFLGLEFMPWSASKTWIKVNFFFFVFFFLSISLKSIYPGTYIVFFIFRYNHFQISPFWMIFCWLHAPGNHYLNMLWHR